MARPRQAVRQIVRHDDVSLAGLAGNVARSTFAAVTFVAAIWAFSPTRSLNRAWVSALAPPP